jgi:threonine dehydratase
VTRRPTLAEVEAAREQLTPHIVRTPLVRLDLGLPDRTIFLKLETLQPIGAFKIRPALNALLSRDRAALTAGVAVASSGNMAYGMAAAACLLGVPMAAYMYSGAPKTKIEGVQRLGGAVRFISMETWWRTIVEAEHPDAAELLINPVTDQAVLAGNGTIGLEIVEDLPEVDAVIAPLGGGGLLAGIACALRALRPAAAVYAAEPETAAPLRTSLAAGEARPFEEWTPSFVDGAGGKSVLPNMWPLLQQLVSDSIVVSLAEAAAAMRLAADRVHVIAEGAAACAVAAALSSSLSVRGHRRIVAVVSGGNIDLARFAELVGACAGDSR